MFSLIPKEESFFIYFDEAAVNLVKGAKAVEDLVLNHTDVQRKVDQIKEIEHAGDSITHKTFDRLNRTFVTPIDREDIHALISGLDDVLDLIDMAASLFAVYKIPATTEHIREMSKILVKACEALQKAVSELRNPKKSQEIMALCREVRTLEKQGDAVIRQAMHNLFEKEKDAIQIIKWKEVYEDMENALDSAQDVANIIEGIILKTS